MKLFIISLVFYLYPVFSFELKDLVGSWKEVNTVCIIPSEEINVYGYNDSIENSQTEILFDTRDDLDNPEPSLMWIHANGNMTVRSKFFNTSRDSNNNFCRSRTTWSGTYSVDQDELNAFNQQQNEFQSIRYNRVSDSVIRMTPAVIYPEITYTYEKVTKPYRKEGCPTGPKETSLRTVFMRFNIVEADRDRQHLYLYLHSNENRCMGENRHLYLMFRKIS